MKGERKGDALENEVALIRTCQEQCAHKAALESNLVFAVSLSDMNAISHHRSECELGALSDFLKSHKWKRKGMTSPQEKKNPSLQMGHFFIWLSNKCQLLLSSFVLLLSAAHSVFKWIFQKGHYVLVLFEPHVSQLFFMWFFDEL